MVMLLSADRCLALRPGTTQDYELPLLPSTTESDLMTTYLSFFLTGACHCCCIYSRFASLNIVLEIKYWLSLSFLTLSACPASPCPRLSDTAVRASAPALEFPKMI